MAEVWRLIIDRPAAGALNMARDEAIAAAVGAGESPPTLRLYRWRPAALSLGRFQPAGVVARDACARAGVEVVRRPSGGRALLHDDELTYALALPLTHAGGESIRASYRRISAALQAGLRHLGVVAELSSGEELRGRHGRSPACFDTPAACELTAGGRKLAGSAQVRGAGALLQHGALPLSPHAERLALLLHDTPPDLGDRMLTLAEALGRAVTFDEVADALCAGVAAAWGAELTPGELSAAEQAAAARLEAEKYAADSWTFGR